MPWHQWFEKQNKLAWAGWCQNQNLDFPSWQAKAKEITLI
jgi:hypothetical protein